MKYPVQVGDLDGHAEAWVRGVLCDSRLVPAPGAVKLDWRSPAISVSQEVTLNLSVMNSSATPPVTAADEGP